MFNVEQFVYTATETKNKKGYQIVAQSEGVTNKIIKKLDSYVYPLGVDPSKFQESRSLVFFGGDLATYSIIKNVGRGYDGRENTIYNHSFVFSEDDFKQCNCDSRVFDKFYLEDKTVKGKLPTLSINPPELLPPLTIDDIDDVLEAVLRALFADKKIALISDSVELPQKILSLVPRSLRMVSFSTFATEPKKQPKYRFILSPKSSRNNITRSFKIISPKETLVLPSKTNFNSCIAYYAHLIKSKDYEKLDRMWKLFEELPGKNHKNKLILLGNYFQYKEAKHKAVRVQHAENAFEALKQFGPNTFSEYLGKIKGSISQYKELEARLQEKVHPRMPLINALLFLPPEIRGNAYNLFTKQQ